MNGWRKNFSHFNLSWSSDIRPDFILRFIEFISNFFYLGHKISAEAEKINLVFRCDNTVYEKRSPIETWRREFFEFFQIDLRIFFHRFFPHNFWSWKFRITKKDWRNWMEFFHHLNNPKWISIAFYLILLKFFIIWIFLKVMSTNIDNKLREDLERLKKIRAHRGLRHYWGYLNEYLKSNS